MRHHVYRRCLSVHVTTSLASARSSRKNGVWNNGFQATTTTTMKTTTTTTPTTIIWNVIITSHYNLSCTTSSQSVLLQQQHPIFIDVVSTKIGFLTETWKQTSKFYELQCHVIQEETLSDNDDEIIAVHVSIIQTTTSQKPTNIRRSASYIHLFCLIVKSSFVYQQQRQLQQQLPPPRPN